MTTQAGPRERGYSELGVALLLLGLGIAVVVDASNLQQSLARTGPVGPRAVPYVVGVLLMVTAVALAADVLRGGRGEQEAGEDVDLSHGSDWRTMGLLSAAFVANILLIDRLGWPVSGAILFFGSAYALGSRHLVRDVIIAFALSIGSWYLFVVALGVKIPVGILNGIL